MRRLAPNSCSVRRRFWSTVGRSARPSPFVASPICTYIVSIVLPGNRDQRLDTNAAVHRMLALILKLQWPHGV